MEEKKLIMYMHAGSGNHGCEAIVNSVCHMIKEKPVLISYYGEEDTRYSLQDFFVLFPFSAMRSINSFLLTAILHHPPLCYYYSSFCFYLISGLPGCLCFSGNLLPALIIPHC